MTHKKSGPGLSWAGTNNEHWKTNGGRSSHPSFILIAQKRVKSREEVSIKMEGRVKRLMDRGYGFIEDLDGDSYFFHRSDLKDIGFDELKEGDLVGFDPEEGEKGKKAANVERIEEKKEGENDA